MQAQDMQLGSCGRVASVDNTATASFMGVGEGKNEAYTFFQQKSTHARCEDMSQAAWKRKLSLFWCK